MDFPFDNYEQHLALASILVDGARNSGTRLLYPTPAWTVGSDPDGWIRPGSAGAPYSRIGVLRARAERLVRDQAESQRVAVTTLRIAPLYGPHCRRSFLLPLFQSAVQGQSLRWPGNRSLRQDLLYVENAAAAIEATLRADIVHEAYAISSGIPMTGQAFCKHVVSLTGGRSRIQGPGGWFQRLRGSRGQDPVQMEAALAAFEEEILLDGTLARETLGYRPPIDLQEGLRRTLRWVNDTNADPSLPESPPRG